MFYNFEFPIALLFKDWPNLYSAFISSVYIVISNELLNSNKLLSLFAVAKVILIFKLQNLFSKIFEVLFFQDSIKNNLNFYLSLISILLRDFKFSILLFFRIESANIGQHNSFFQMVLGIIFTFIPNSLNLGEIFLKVFYVLG